MSKLERISPEAFDSEKLYKMREEMCGLLDHPESSSLTLEELLEFQDKDGSFKLINTYMVPGDVREAFCHTPTYIGAAVLMKALMSSRDDLDASLEKALKECLHTNLYGPGYDSESGRIHAMKIFIKGGLCEFLNTKHELCPDFHQMIHNILHEYSVAFMFGKTAGCWGKDYRDQWKDCLDKLPIHKRFYIAYGSNMNKNQMQDRCKNAVCVGSAYIEDWQLTLPFYANIEPQKGSCTPALVWEIDEDDESALDIYEGYQNQCYNKTDIIITVNNHRVSAMAYVMTRKYKRSEKKAPDPDGYVGRIKQGYKDAGFNEDEFKPLLD